MKNKSTKSSTKQEPGIYTSYDDNAIIERMKHLGIWEKMKKLSKPDEKASIISKFEMFVWDGKQGDSGYSYFRCENPADLLLLMAIISGELKPIKRLGSSALH